MGDTNLHGVLNMPPELWTNDELGVMQRYGRYIEASERIKNQQAEIAILQAASERYFQEYKIQNAAIAQLQREKAILEDRAKDLRAACEQKQEIIDANASLAGDALELKRAMAELQRLCERAYLVIDENYEKLCDGEFGPSSLLKDLGKAKDGKELRDVNLLNEVLAKANKHLQAEHAALVERVKVHNSEMLAMCESNPRCNKKNGYPNVRCIDCQKENLISLD